ncbi:hypothetical protein GGTG_09224 [Gaeumannomyces tritici R3-111a-1]|uniref:Uncharacterized protein n=1 Tax=Gaeumannomyces tritici (strain R3-111a-1) TaxID=644352 RepID=J3P6T2_GAET3|nr:hypothetical protein GGTG_09224 [Gaeumannomyces tritici R3-111a-1]EJT72358.1 hypothetical protein GGTG_09224 [Gaeumannomyces tritici R3-111a-1]
MFLANVYYCFKPLFGINDFVFRMARLLFDGFDNLWLFYYKPANKLLFLIIFFLKFRASQFCYLKLNKLDGRYKFFPFIKPSVFRSSIKRCIFKVKAIRFFRIMLICKAKLLNAWFALNCKRFSIISMRFATALLFCLKSFYCFSTRVKRFLPISSNFIAISKVICRGLIGSEKTRSFLKAKANLLLKIINGLKNLAVNLIIIASARFFSFLKANFGEPAWLFAQMRKIAVTLLKICAIKKGIKPIKINNN